MVGPFPGMNVLVRAPWSRRGHPRRDRRELRALFDVMAGLRGQGRSFAFVARELYARHGIEVTGETVRSWCDQLGIDKPTKAGAA